MEAKICKLKEALPNNPNWYYPIFDITNGTDHYLAQGLAAYSEKELYKNFGLTTDQIKDLKA